MLNPLRQSVPHPPRLASAGQLLGRQLAELGMSSTFSERTEQEQTLHMVEPDPRLPLPVGYSGLLREP